MSKSLIIEKNLEYNIMLEKKILSKIKSKFIVNMKCAFQDFSRLYLILELMTGGNLRYHLNHYEGHFQEKMIKFVIVNISLCLALIHYNNIVHRDIQPENFLFDENGYLHLTDFNSAVYIEEENERIDMIKKYENTLYNEEDNKKNDLEKELRGTISYIAPEYILSTENNITFSSDFYSFGVICYELIFLQKPFLSKTRYLLGKEMLSKKINYNCDFNYSENLINLVKKLLATNPDERIGTSKGFNEIQTCEYLYEFNWENFLKQKYESPFVEVIKDFKKKFNYRKKDDMELFDYPNNFNFDEEKILKLNLIESDPNFLNYFQDYYYVYFEKNDFNSELNSTNDIFKVKNNIDKNKRNIGEKKIIKEKKREKIARKTYSSSGSCSTCLSCSRSHSSCSRSSCTCSCSICNKSNYSNDSSDVDSISYFKQKDRYKNKKKIVYLPKIIKEEKIIIPEMYPKILLDAYRYKIIKYRKLLNKIEEKNKIKLQKEREKERLNKTEKKESKKYNLDKRNYFPNPNPFISNNFYNPNKFLLNSSSSMPNFHFQLPNIYNLSKFYPFPNQFNQIYFQNDENKYSFISSSETYDNYIRKNNNNTKNKEEISKKEIKEKKKIKKNKKLKKKEEYSKSTTKKDISKKPSSKRDDSEKKKKSKLSTIKESSGEYKTSS